MGRMILVKMFSPISFLPGEPNGSPHTGKPITSCGHITKAVTAAVVQWFSTTVLLTFGAELFFVGGRGVEGSVLCIVGL